MSKTYGHVLLRTPDGGPHHWHVKGQAHVMMRLKRMFPRVRATRGGGFTIGDTPEIARDLSWTMERWPMEITPADLKYLRERTQQRLDSEAAIDRILGGGHHTLTSPNVPDRNGRDYQMTAADLVLATGRLLLADTVGLGKTMSGLLVLRDPDALPALFVTLTHLPKQMLGELHKTYPWMRGHIIRNGDVYDPAQARGMHGMDPHVVFISYSKLAKWADVLAGRVNTVIFDEMQELRRPGTLKYVAAATIADGCRYRMGLTATPVFNYGDEIHSIVNILDDSSLGTRDEFLREWGGGSRGMSGHATVKEPATLGVYLREQGIMLRRTRKDVGRELPETIKVVQNVDVDADTLTSLLGDVEQMANLILSTGDRTGAFQAAGDIDWRMRHATGVAKAPFVAEFVRLILQSEEKVVLFGWHRDVYDIWAEALKDFNPVMYTGSESIPAKQRATAQFLGGDQLEQLNAGKDPRRPDYTPNPAYLHESRVLMMSLRSGAGVDGLQEVCKVAVFGELDWSPAIHDQCEGRLGRDGMGDEPVLAYYMVSDDGSDPVVSSTLLAKRGQSAPINDPDAEIFQQAASAQDRARLLAERALQRLQEHPAPTEAPDTRQGRLEAV